jgi:hypothetical protein
MAPIWLLVTTGLACTAWQWSRYFFQKDRLLDTLAHAIVLSWAAIVTSAMLLSLGSWLSGLNLLVVVAFLGLVGMLMLRRMEVKHQSSFYRMDGSDKLWLGLWCLIVGFWSGHIVSDGLWHFPTDWDTLNYHLPAVNHWLQAHSLSTAAGQRWFVPGNNELLALWAVSPFSGDFLATLNNLPCTALLACTAISLATRCGLSREVAHVCGITLTAHLVVLKQLIDNENDVAVAALFFAAILYALRLAQDGGTSNLSFAGISIGLLAGVKYYAMGYALLAFASLGILAAVTRGHRSCWKALILASLGAFLFSGYWYIRNFLIGGSPLYPKAFNATDTMSHVYPEVAYTTFFGNRRPELWALYAQAIWKMTGPSQLCGFILFPLSVAWLLLNATCLWLQGKDRGRALPYFTLATLICGTGLVLGITPFAVEDEPGTLNQMHMSYCPVRYGMCFLSLSTLGLFVVIRDVLFLVYDCACSSQAVRHQEPRTRDLLCFVILVIPLGGAAAFQCAFVDQRRVGIDLPFCGLFALNSALVSCLFYFAWNMCSRARVVISGLLGLLILVLTVWAGHDLSQAWHTSFTVHYERQLGHPDVLPLASPPKDVITICPLVRRYYPFFGSERQYRVCQPFFAPSGEWLLGYLRDAKVDYVFCHQRPSNQEMRAFPGVCDYIAEHTNLFRLFGETDSFKIYRFIR